MSLLAQQLNRLKQNNAASIAPGAHKPSLILDKQTARNTTVDVLYTMAVLGYDQIRKEMLFTGRNLGEQLLSQQYKQINRNKLSKQENKALSIKITRFLLIISPLFLNRGCQAIIEYLLRNFNIHVFESEQVVLIFLQYWQHEAYTKLIANIQIKTTNLQFIKSLQQKKQVNLTYIIKSLTYSRSLLQSLIMFTKRYIKQQNEQNEQIEVQLLKKPTLVCLKVQQSTIVKHDIKQFVLQILIAVLQRKVANFNKQICQLCVFTSKQDSEQTYSMAMMLTIASLSASSQQAHSEWVQRVIKNLLAKSVQINESIFNFVMVVWQRWPFLINSDIISILMQKQHFVLRLTQTTKSVYMIYYTLFQYFLQRHLPNKGLVFQILQALCLKVKQQQFVKLHQTIYFNQIFKLVHSHFDKLQKNEQKITNTFIVNFLLYQYAVYVIQNKISPLPSTFSKQQVNKNNQINIKHIHKVVKKQEEQRKQQQKIAIQQQQEEQEQREEEQEKENKTILKVINSWSKKQYQTYDINAAEIKNIIMKLLANYYSQNKQQSGNKLTLTRQQKNRILQNPQLFAQAYKLDQFQADLSQNDYSTCIRYLLLNGNIQMCSKVLSKLATGINIAGDILYRELCRQAIDKLVELTAHHYKAVINMLGKLYHNYCKNMQPQLVKPINQMMIKLSGEVIRAAGKEKGKFYKLIANHAKMLAKLTLSLAHREAYALQTYLRLIDIFGADNSYCFLIGAAELLATKQKNKKQFANFIDKVLIASLYVDTQQQTQPQFVQYRSILRLFQTFNKCLIFSYSMLQQTKLRGQVQRENEEQQQIKQNNQIHGIEPGVAKKMITNFFGLTSSKDKRAIVRKVFMFLSTVFKSQKLAFLFKETLSTINRKQQLKLSTIASKIYNLLINIYNQTNGPLKQVTKYMKINILKLFPLQLKVDVLGSLLPLNEIYAELAHDLQEHGTRKFDNLTHFVNIVPNQTSDEWCRFATQCLSRGYFPSQQSCKQILSLNSSNADNTNLVKFICKLTQFAKEECLGLLDQMMAILLNQCKDSSDYALAILYTVTKNLKEFIDPYLSDIFKIGIEIQGEHVFKFIDGLVQSFTPPTLVALTKSYAKSVQNSENFTYFLNKISEKVTFESIWKTCQSFFARSLNSLVQQQKLFDKLHEQQSEVFCSQAMKMNDSQLRKIIIEYVRWSSQRTQFDNMANLHFNSRKSLLLIIFQKMTNKLSDLFIHFYGYIFDDIVKDIQSLSIMLQLKTSLLRQDGKRDRPMTQYSLQCNANYLKHVLDCLKSLFDNDISNQFMDSIKFDRLAPQIANIFNMVKYEEHYASIMNEHLKPCLLSLFKNTKDDYKLKTINTQILRLLRTKNTRITNAIYAFYDQVADQIQYRFLLFTDELIPLLIEASSTRNITVKKSAESIIYKIQTLSGQKIDKFSR